MWFWKLYMFLLFSALSVNHISPRKYTRFCCYTYPENAHAFAATHTPKMHMLCWHIFPKNTHASAGTYSRKYTRFCCYTYPENTHASAATHTPKMHMLLLLHIPRKIHTLYWHIFPRKIHTLLLFGRVYITITVLKQLRRRIDIYV